MTTRTADAVVVGAGIVGCATACYLAKAGVGAVLADGDGIDRHASGFAYGLDAQGPPIDCSIGWRGNYATTKPDGLLWAGTTEDAAGFDEEPTAAARRSVLGNLLRMLPALKGARVIEQTACLRPMTPDGNAMLGKAPGLRGVYVATGGGRKGILYGPAMGDACADLIVSGATDLDLSPYDPGRFRMS